MKRGWKKYLLYSGGLLSVGTIVYFLILLIIAGYPFAWTGFGDYTAPTGEFFRHKTFWDWLDLLIVPMVLAGGAIFLNRSERQSDSQRAEERAKVEREIATDRQREDMLQSYIDRMADLLLNGKLRTTKNKEVRDVARTRTLSVLRGLDVNRKNHVVQFLVEAKLFGIEKPIIELQGADLSGAKLSDVYLSGADLSNADLSGARLIGAQLSGAKLSDVYLSGANLWGAYLSGADLSGANLKDANLSLAKFSGANLSGADLSNADLSGADLSRANLSLANLNSANLKDVILSEVFLTLANLSSADLSRANLSLANLNSANLSLADLSNADLSGADLHGVNLGGANLQGAKNITEEQLASAKSLNGATLPDGTKHT